MDVHACACMCMHIHVIMCMCVTGPMLHMFLGFVSQGVKFCSQGVHQLSELRMYIYYFISPPSSTALTKPCPRNQSVSHCKHNYIYIWPSHYFYLNTKLVIFIVILLCKYLAFYSHNYLLSGISEWVYRVQIHRVLL